ncbi:MAG: SirB2 family protein [Pseudomonadales bacterium]
MYIDIKTIHMVLAFISVAGFIYRGMLLMVSPGRLSHSLIRTLPHVIDTCLLATGVYLATQSHQYPFANSAWLSSKMLALLAYIAFGMIAFRLGSQRVFRIGSYLIALSCAVLMIWTAMHKSVLIFS